MALGVTSYPSTLDDNSTIMVAKDFAQSPLFAIINSAVTSLTVQDGTRFPSTGGVVLIDSELISYTTISTNSLQGLTRGVNGTTAASHNGGVNVTLIASANYHNVLKDAVIALQTELGTLPKGTYADVKTRLNTVESTTKRGCVMKLLGGTTPAVTGPDTEVGIVPYSPDDGTTALTWNIRRIKFRVEVTGTTTSTVVIQKSVGGGTFTATTVATLNLTLGNYEVFTTSSLGTVTSGQLLRCNISVIGTGAAQWTVQIEMEQQ